jgi:hypothetical protein
MAARTITAAIVAVCLSPSVGSAQSLSDLKALHDAIKLFQSANELSAKVDDLLGKTMPPSVTTPDGPKLTGVYLVLEFTYTGQTASVTYYNETFGRRVPGRDVTVTVEGVDAVVEAKFDLKQATIERDKDYPDLLTVTLPKPQLTAKPSAGKEYRVAAVWGEMRGRSEPKTIIERLTTQAQAAIADDAKGRFERDDAANVGKAVQRSLREKFPGAKIYVK